MVNRPSVPEIITVNSETLQTQVRDLLPSQNGFGSELQASNVITPIIDLTRAAEGSTVPEILQTAIAFGSITSYNVVNTNTDIANAVGFYRVFGLANVMALSTASGASFRLVNGATTKVVWEITPTSTSTNNSITSVIYDFVVFLAPSDVLNVLSDNTGSSMVGCIRQIADSEGKLLPPSGFPL